jgi:phage terminase large subunit
MTPIQLKIKLTAKQKSFDRAIERYEVVGFGGARGGGKSYGLRNIFLKRRLQYPKTHAFIFRRTYPELISNHEQPLLEEFPDLRQFYNQSKHVLTLPNGSTLSLRYCRNEQEVDQYRGVEIHDLGLEEAGDISEVVFQRLRGSNRSSVPNYKPRCALTFNPGGVGHRWLKRMFIDKIYRANERGDDYHFIPSKVWDNPALLKNDPDYIKRLEAEPSEVLRKAYLEGSFDIFAGQFFAEVERDVHMVEPFDIPKHWNRFAAYDYGFNHPAACVFFASDEDGVVYAYREHGKAGQRVDEQAAVIRQEKAIHLVWAGHDCWAKRGVGPTIAEEFSKHGVILRQANIDRIQGAAQIRSHLAYKAGEWGPRLKVFKSCPMLFDCLIRMQHNPNSVEDVLKVDAVEGDPWTGDDLYDALRYGLMSRPIKTRKPRQPWRDGYDRDNLRETTNWKTI